VSIIIPVHKTIPYLKECINSVLCQTHIQIEIIIACNGSLHPIDCKFFLNVKDSRITYIKTRTGRHHARNEALQKAKGEYIQFLDYDDYLFEDKIESQIFILNKFPDKQMISICKWKKFNENIKNGYKFPFDHLFKNNETTFFNLIASMGEKGGFVATAAWLVRKSDVIDIKWIDAPNDDAVFFSELYFKNPSISMIDRVLVGYRMHDSNSSTIQNKEQFDLLIRGWLQISRNLKSKASKDIYHYLYRAFAIILKLSRAFNFYRYIEILGLVIFYSIKARQRPIDFIKTVKRSFN
jgi:glycosyltransferase involved in cell wall biosynthesis